MWKFILDRLLYNLLNRLVVLACLYVFDNSLSISDGIPSDEVGVDVSELFVLILYDHLRVAWLVSQTNE